MWGEGGREGREVHQAYVHTHIRSGRGTLDMGHGTWDVGVQAIIMYTDGAPSYDADMWEKEGVGL